MGCRDWRRGGSSPVGADLVDAEVVGVGGQQARDLSEEIGRKGGPAAGGHHDSREQI